MNVSRPQSANQGYPARMLVPGFPSGVLRATTKSFAARASLVIDLVVAVVVAARMASRRTRSSASQSCKIGRASCRERVDILGGSVARTQQYRGRRGPTQVE